MPLYGFPISNAMPLPAPTVGFQREKRKLWEQQGSDIDVGGMEVLEEFSSCPAKRHCKEIFPDPTGDNGIVVQHGRQFMFLQTPPQSLCQESTPQLVASDELYGCMRDTGGATHQTVTSEPGRYVISPAQGMQQPVEMGCPMMMDGETYSPVSVNDLDHCFNSMDSDCTPDPSQYDLRVEYCGSRCTGGVRSPVSNDIRCSCRSRVAQETEYYHSDYY